MTPLHFIEKNVMAELLKQGFNESTARTSTNKAIDHYRRSVSSSGKGKMFDDCLNIAKQWAIKSQPKKTRA